MADDAEWFREITDSGVVPSPAGAGALLLHSEEPAACLVVLMVHRHVDRSTKVALLTLVDCIQSVFGYPNDEAYWGDPRRRASNAGPGYGFYEVVSSSWPARIAEYNRHSFPGTRVDGSSRHFFVGCHDASGEFLANDLIVEVFDEDFHTVLGEALGRIERR